MSFPPPTERQARVFWFALTVLAVVMVLALGGVVLWGIGWVINRLSSVLLPLAASAILACLLDPAVDWFEKTLKIPRTRAILLVFFLALMVVLILLATVVPQLVFEVRQLIENLPQTLAGLKERLRHLLAQTPAGLRLRDAWDKELGDQFQGWLSENLPVAANWLLAQLGKAASWFGLIVGLALVPVYTFYFLLEKAGILRNWHDYLPLRESKTKEEVVFIVESFNACMVAFFRGQVLVALCSGVMLAVGYTLLGLPYAVLLGTLAAVLGIVPYLGNITSVTLACIIAAVHFKDWWHPLLVLAVFAVQQFIEGFFIAPRIIGKSVGLHPLTVIIALVTGSTLMGGIIGGILAIPITAALRTLMFRYVWKKRSGPGVAPG